MNSKHILIIIAVMTILLSGCTDKIQPEEICIDDIKVVNLNNVSEEQEKKNNIQSEAYKNAILITYLKYENGTYIINNKSGISYPEFILIPNDSEARFIITSTPYENCNQNIIIGDRECVTEYITDCKIFVNESINTRIEKARGIWGYSIGWIAYE